MRNPLVFVALLCLALAAPAIAAPRISIDARDTQLVDVLRLLSLQSGMNLVADGSIRPQRVTFRLHDVDLDTALATLAQAYNLQTHRDGNVTLIGDAAAMSRRYAGGIEATAPRTEIVPLAHARPEELTEILQGALPAGTVVVPDKRSGSIVITASAPSLERARTIVTALDAEHAEPQTPREAVPLRHLRPTDAVKIMHGAFPEAALMADDRSNTVLLHGTTEMIANAKAMLEAVDRPGRQVLFEVRVADVKPIDDTSNVGVEFGGTGFASGALGQFPYTLTKSSVVVNVQVNALVQTGRAEIIATPRIATLNNREALLLVGEQYPVVTVNQQTGFPSVQTIDVGVRLRLTPTIGDDGTITAELHPEYSQIIGYNASFPIVANRKVDASLRVHDGETIVLGGLFQDVSSESIERVPVLGNLPVLGGLFRNKQRTHSRDEVVFFITPRIL